MKSKFIFSVFLGLMLISCVYASETIINVNTLSNHDVSILILKDSDTYSLMQAFQNRPSGQYGNVSVTYASDGVDTIKVQIIVKQNGEQVLSKKFAEQDVGGVLDFEVLPDWAKEEPVVVANNDSSDENTSVLVIEDTQEVETTKVEEKKGNSLFGENTNSSTNTGNTGFLISEFNGTFLKNKFFWIILGVILVGIVALFVMKRSVIFHGKKSSKSKVVKIKTRHGESIKLNSESKKTHPSDVRINVPDVEKEISEMRGEIERLKGSGNSQGSKTNSNSYNKDVFGVD